MSASETIAALALVLDARLARLRSGPFRTTRPKSLDDYVAQENAKDERERERAPFLAALSQARDILFAAAQQAPEWRPVVQSLLFPPGEEPPPSPGPMLDLGLRAPRNFETPLEQATQAYYAEVARYSSDEGAECELDAHNRLQAAVALWRLDPSESHQREVKAAAQEVRFHGPAEYVEREDELPHGSPLIEGHPLLDADFAAEALNPEYHNRVAAKQMLLRSRSLLELASALLSPKQRLALSVAGWVLSSEIDSIRTHDRVEKKANAKGRKANPTNQAIQDVIACLVLAAPPGSPAEIAEIITTRYQHPITGDQVSTHISNMEKADKRDGKGRLMAGGRQRQKPGRRKPVIRPR